MNAIEHNDYTEAWRSFGASVPRPRAILCISAHWYINAGALTAMATPRTIHDFYGFPPELFAVEYPAPGSPEVAEEIADLLEPTWVGLDTDSWGIDHGTWSVLVHAFPEADVPVLQLSIDASKPFEHHLELGARLAPLRDRGVLVVGSGNVVHNLHRIDWTRPSEGFDWAARFDGTASALLADDPGRAVTLTEHPDWSNAAPTPEHFIPLLYLAGVAAAADEPAEALITGCAYGSLSMTSYVVGASRPASTSAPPHDAAELPAGVDPQATNT
jgi:4,5-DOPA dioxygenase extradiol